jgi:hypothetical protein
MTTLLTPSGSVVSGLTMDVALLGLGFFNNRLVAEGVEGGDQGAVEDDEELSLDGEEDVV